MPNLNWNEVRDRAIAFSHRWADEASEAAGKQTFWNEFFAVFGRDRRTVASFEVAVRNVRGDHNYIDLLWRGVLLVEHKSAGKSLDAAESQAFAYVADLAREGRFEEIPRYIIVSDFRRFALYDLEPEEERELPLFAGRPYALTSFPLAEFHRVIRRFAFLKGERTMRLDPEDPANEKAYDKMCQLHDELAALGFTGTDLERLLVRLLFCVFADDTGVFEPATFETFILQHTREDGSDVGARLNQLFDVLNTREDEWSAPDRETFAGFRYINGDLFKDRLRFPPFTRTSHAALLAACQFQWARVSPAVFGSLFQGILDAPTRRQQGAHYTSERDILKVINSLFLEALKAEFKTLAADRSTRRKARLEEFHARLRSLRFLDPACGCGNFLVLAYRELRLLELDTLRERHADDGQRVLDVREFIRVDVDQFYGIELSEWPKRIAEVAMWLMDHQMNQQASVVFGQSFERLPLRNSPHIVQGNALRLDWRTVLPPAEGVYVMGNPPFVGHHYQSKEQKEDQQEVLQHIAARGVLDFVSNWYVKAADYITGSRVPVAFVSTNSITQGEQAGILWTELIGRWHVKIHFAHRTFPWASEARGRAHVHVVIVGFGTFDVSRKHIYDYAEGEDHVLVSEARNISPYLVEGPDVALTNRSTPLADVPKMSWGNKPTDGGNFILSPEERTALLVAEPGAAPFVRRYMSGGDFINGEERYCLWLKDAPPDALRRLPQVMKRVEAVRDSRLASKAESTRRYAEFPTLFRQIAQPDSDYLAIPEVSSERRRYIPIAYLSRDIICSNKIQFIPDAKIWHFGVLTSLMHMAWMRAVGGRLKSDFSYSNTLVYNNYPWPDAVDAKQRAAVETAAQSVLDARIPFLPPVGTGTLADLYDPLTMPPALARAHSALDRAVDRCYRPKAFESDRERVEHLFALYERASAPLLPTTVSPGRRVRLPRAAVEPPPDSAPNVVPEDEEPDGSEGTLPTKLPPWYLEAFRSRPSPEDRGEMVSDPLDIIYERVDNMLCANQLAECDEFLVAVADEPEHRPLSTLIGVLTITLAADKKLPNRARLREVVHRRLLANGQRADAALQGL